MKTLIITILLGIAFAGIAMAVIDDNPEVRAKEVFEEVNKAREKGQLPPLSPDTCLENLALKHSQLMEKTGECNHSSYGIRENILCGGGTSGKSIVDAWMGSPLHKRNIMLKGATICGIGIKGQYATFLVE